MENLPAARSPHTAAVPLFSGVLEPSSAPEQPAQAQARGPHTAAALPFSEEGATSQDPQKTELNEAEHQYSALSSDDMVDQALSLSSSAHVLPPAYGNQEEGEAHPTSARPSDPFPYSAVGRMQHQPWDQEGGMMGSPDDSYNSQRSELDTDSHTPVNTIHTLLPPGSWRRRGVLSCFLVITILAIVLGVVFGMKKSNSSINLDNNNTSPHGPDPSATNTFFNGITQGTTSTGSNASVGPTPTPANTLEGLWTTAGLHQTITARDPLTTTSTTTSTTTTTVTEATTTTTTDVPMPPTPTTSSCIAECDSRARPCAMGCVLSGDACTEKCKDPGGCGCIGFQVTCYQKCSASIDACKADCSK